MVDYAARCRAGQINSALYCPVVQYPGFYVIVVLLVRAFMGLVFHVICIKSVPTVVINTLNLTGQFAAAQLHISAAIVSMMLNSK